MQDNGLLRHLLSACMATALLCSAAFAQPAENATAFGAAESAAPAEAGDYKAMLAVCDQKLESCEKDAIGVPFLAGAYMALWLIVLGFLFTSRLSLKRTRQELTELRARLMAIEEESGR